MRACAAALALCCAATPARAVKPRFLGPPVKPQVQRVVTLAPSLTELVLALGAGERLVGVTRFDDDPRVAKLPRVGGYNDPEPETVLRLKPDLVLAQPAPENRGPVETLGRLGLAVEAYPLGTVAEIEDALRSVGVRLGLKDKAQALVEDIERARARARAEAPAKNVRVLLVFGLEPLVVAGTTGFAGELLSDLGAVNVASEARPFYRTSPEAVARAQPDVVVLCGVDAPKDRPAIPGVTARLVPLRGMALLHPGPRLAEALQEMRAALGPR